MNMFQKNDLIFGEDHRDPSYGEREPYRKLVKRYRKNGVTVQPDLGDRIDPSTIRIRRLKQFPGKGWQVLSRSRRQAAKLLYPWSDMVWAVKPAKSNRVIVQAAPPKPLPNFRITCETCENQGTCPQYNPDRLMQITRTSGETVTFEFKRGSVYFDADVPEESVTMLENGTAVIHELEQFVHMPAEFHRDTYRTYYESPQYREELARQRGLRSYRLDSFQRHVWVRSQQDGQLYLFRVKDLSPKGSMRRYQYQSRERECPHCNGKGKFEQDLLSGVQECPFCKEGKIPPRWQGPNTALRLKHPPTELMVHISHPHSTININGVVLGDPRGHWESLGSISEEHAMGRLSEGCGGPVHRVQTLSLLDNDVEEAWDDLDFYESQEYNGPMQGIEPPEACLETQ